MVHLLILIFTTSFFIITTFTTLSSASYYVYQLVKCDSSCSSTQNAHYYNKVFILKNGYRKEVPTEAIPYFQENNGNAPFVETSSTILDHFQPGKIISNKLIRRTHSLDENLDLELEEIRSFTEYTPKMLSKETICDYGCKNPSVIKWNGYGLTTYELKWKDRVINFVWANTTDYLLPIIPKEEITTYRYLGLKVLQGEHSGMFYTLSGADARLLVIDDNLLLAFHEYPNYHMSMSVLRKTTSLPTGQISATPLATVTYVTNENPSNEDGNHPFTLTPNIPLVPDMNAKSHHKSWVPFLYEPTKQVMLIQTLNPLHVVTYANDETLGKTKKENSGNNSGNGGDGEARKETERVRDPYASYLPPPIDSYVQVFTVSYTEATLPWMYGELLGGTNVIKVGDVYLGFFHSHYTAKGNVLGTYFMGAYTFSTEMPFKLLSMSPYPIIIDSLYNGLWFGKRYNYVVFPTSLQIIKEEKTGQDIALVTIGLNDFHGFAVKYYLMDILQSLVPVN